MTRHCFQVASSCILPSIMCTPRPSGIASMTFLANATSSERGEVGRAEAHALDARRGGGDLLEVRDAERGLEDRVDEDRPLQAGACLELPEQSVDVVDVPGPLDLGNHHDLELVADLADDVR